jgi:hypothetical protein
LLQENSKADAILVAFGDIRAAIAKRKERNLITKTSSQKGKGSMESATIVRYLDTKK